MPNNIRALRRHHYKRMKKRAVKMLKAWEHHGVDAAAKWANNKAICSCDMCCNQRRNGWGTPLTMSERKAENSADLQIEELNDEVH